MLQLNTPAPRRGRVSTKAIKDAPVESAKRSRQRKQAAEVDALFAPVLEKAIRKGAKTKKVAQPEPVAPAPAPKGKTLFTLPDGATATCRTSGKRAAIVRAWLVNNRITLDEVASITGWAKAVNSSELFQIAAIFKRKIERNGAGEYFFVID